MLKFTLIAGLVMCVIGCLSYVVSFFIEKAYKHKMKEMSEEK